MTSQNANGAEVMSELTKCGYCLEIMRCDMINGSPICEDCQFFMNDNEPEVTEQDIEDQYQMSIDNPFGLEVIDDEQYVAPPEQEFDDFDLGSCEDYYDDSMDGDHESAFGSIGWGENEYYNDDWDNCDPYGDF